MAIDRQRYSLLVKQVLVLWLLLSGFVALPVQAFDVNVLNARFSGCPDITIGDCSGATLLYTGFSYANLSGANLSNIDMAGADLSYANLTGANLNGNNFSGAQLSGTNLTGANLTNSNMADVNLSNA
ncbi:MAG TPA: pentapeptide repeat-containing protein, partial [Pseudomonadales bacterium]|nr:pentapeptide repeat-containing protein [Pseudomonadales bacterium]